MASYRAIATVCEGVLDLLRDHYRREDFNNDLEFTVYQARDFSQPMPAGVSLFLFRIVPNSSQRNPAGRLTSEGRRQRPQLPLDLHFILTVWGKDASLQHAIVGWMMRVLHDTPIIPAGHLNRRDGPVFHPAETVELMLSELPNEDLLRLWETLVDHSYHLSIPYLARMVMVESTRTIDQGEPVQERNFEYATALDEPTNSSGSPS